MNSIARLNVHQTAVFSVIVILGLIFTSAYPSPFANCAVLLLSILAISGAMPTQNSNLRIALSFTFTSIGLVLYLVIRGFFPQKPITNFDFVICVVSLMVIATLPAILKSGNQQISFRNLETSAISGSTALLICVTYSSYLYSKGIGFFLAWTGAGDSRNHIQSNFKLANDGFIEVVNLGTPYLTNAIPVFLNAGSSLELGVDSSQRLLSDWTSYTLTWLLLIAMLGFAFAAVWEIALAGFTNKSKNLLLVPASFIAVTSFTLGTYLMDGFISAIAGSIAVAISCALVFENSTKSSWTKLFVMGLAVIFAVLTWTLILIPVLILMLPKFWEWLDVPNRSTGMYLRVSVTLIGVVFVTYAFVTFYSAYLFSILNTSGRIQAADARAFIVLLLVILFLAILNVSRKSPTGFQLALISLSGAATIYALNRMSGIPFLSLNYYSAKAMMILFVGMLPVALIMIPIGIRLINNYSHIRPVRMAAISAYATLVIYFATEFISPFPKVWNLMNNGWFQPSAQTATEVIGLANDPSNPTVFFKYNPSNSGETRLGNFWLGTYADPVSPIKSWAYVGDQEGNYAAFCELNSYYSRMTVLTRDPNLNIRMKANCREEELEAIFVN
jgi:hypothetical protein